MTNTSENISRGNAFTAHQSGRIRIVHIISDLSVGGAEMMLYKLLAETDFDRFEPVVVSLVSRGDLRTRIEALGVPVHMLGMKPGVPSPFGFWRLVRLLRCLKPHFILGWMYHSCLAAQLARPFLPRGAKVFWSIHYANHSLSLEKSLTRLVIKICARLSNFAHQIIFVSYASREEHRKFGYFLGKSCVIPNGINTSEFVPSPESRASVRSELSLSPEALLIGTAGRYHPTKDHANFLSAAALLAKTHPQANFVMIGQGVDEKNAQLRQLIDGTDLDARVHLLGERQDVPRIAAALDIFSLASCSESFPNVIGEAMACKVPCVVTRVGDAPWIVGDTGLIVPPRDSEALAAAWSRMIELGEQERLAIGRSARLRVIDYFRLDSVAALYEALFSMSRKQEASDEFGRPALSLPCAGFKARLDDSSMG